jgi:hypothetical protein
MFSRFKTLVPAAGGAIPLEAFVFVPVKEGPLSWHLSRSDKDTYVLEQWNNKQNLEELQEFVRFVKGETR